MICYASNTGTRRNLTMMRLFGWRLMISRTGSWNTRGMSYALDNGAWTDYRTGQDFDTAKFQALVDALGRKADFVVAPDIVAGGLLSLRSSLVWLAPLLVRTRLVLVPVQDGMGPEDLVNVVIPNHVGIFLGGSTEWKISNMRKWGEFCAERGIYYHVGRVNTLKRFRFAHFSGADSVDGSSASRYANTLPPLDCAARQWDMWAPPKNYAEQLAWASSPSEVNSFAQVAEE